jgi:hypothetical protein
MYDPTQLDSLVENTPTETIWGDVMRNVEVRALALENIIARDGADASPELLGAVRRLFEKTNTESAALMAFTLTNISVNIATMASMVVTRAQKSLDPKHAAEVPKQLAKLQSIATVMEAEARLGGLLILNVDPGGMCDALGLSKIETEKFVQQAREDLAQVRVDAKSFAMSLQTNGTAEEQAEAFLSKIKASLKP